MSQSFLQHFLSSVYSSNECSCLVVWEVMSRSSVQAHTWHEKQEEPPDMECHICMDADVEVEVDSCKHKMCIACAKAVCSLSSRAPQCPFCRAAITRIVPIAPAA